MSEEHVYHRRGEPGGPGCRVVALSVNFRREDGASVAGNLLDAGTQATELELLRTVAHRYGVKWGHDDLGWWATVPSS